jgi:hypothetical protein
VQTKIFSLFFYISFTIYAQIGDYALKFDGMNDYVKINDNNNLDLTNNYTIECWIKVDSFKTYSGLVSKVQSSNANGYVLRLNNTDVYFDGKSTSGLNLQRGVWYHIAAVNNNGNRYLYVNGVNKTLNGTNITISANTDYLAIGTDYNKASANKWYFKGKIDEVRIWSIARSQDDILKTMYKELSGSETGLVAYYKMSNGSGTTLSDNKVNGSNSGTITNGAEWTFSGCFAGSRNALNFDGNSKYVSFSTSSSPPYNSNLFTIEAWIKTTSTESEKELLGWGLYIGTNTVDIKSNLGKLKFGINYGTSESVLGNIDINTGNWTHIAVVKQGTLVKLYVNGVFDNSGEINLNPVVDIFTIGGQRINGNIVSTSLFSGQIDEVRIWNIARNDVEIRESMMKNLKGDESGLVAYYRCDNYSGQTLYNLTSNSFNGALTNMNFSDLVISTPFNIWLGGESSSWLTAANWSNGVPSSNSNIGLYKWNLSNITTYEAEYNNNFTANCLFIATNSNPILPNEFTVNGNLLLNKNLDITAKNITLGSNGYLCEGNNWLYGTSGEITTTRTLGTLLDFTNIGGLGLEIKSTSELGNTTIKRGMALQSNDLLSNPISRYYDITSTGGGIRDIIFHYNEADLKGDEENLSVFKSEDVGLTWTKLSGTRNTTDNTVLVTGLTSFSRFTLADEGSPLPVELQSLKATVNGNMVEITWQTITEINCYGFEIERKQDNLEMWNNIGFVAGHGNCNSIKNYLFLDKTVTSGKYFYRLKQLDIDGKYTYSRVIEIDIKNIPTKYELAQNYPNPFNPSTTIKFTIPQKEFVTLKIYDILGKEVTALINEEMNAGNHTKIWEAKNLSSGVYFYKLNAGKFTETKKMILVR